MTFFSSAARIWSQGLSTEACEVANAIELILACVACLMPEQFNHQIQTMALSCRGAMKPFDRIDESRVPGCIWVALEFELGAAD
jgi:hypothetical protein